MKDEHKIRHLYRRVGFGFSPKEWKNKDTYNWETTVHALLANRPPRALVAHDTDNQQLTPARLRAMSNEEKLALRKEEGKKVGKLAVNWLGRMADPDEHTLLERMTLFWHGHFACESQGSKPALAQLNTLRQHALGNFGAMVKAISRDVSMIRYLNNQQNRKDQPNENYARELMELFTLGRGHYSETDIKEAARAFTGWSSNFFGDFVFRRHQHDYGTKTFMGQSGPFDGDEIIDIILEKRQCARFIAGKVYRYFVSPSADEAHIEELATVFYDSNYEISAMMHRLFMADWFYDSRYVGSKIKSPIELMAGMMRQLDIRFENALGLNLISRALGQRLFKPPNVAGWPGGKSWINNATLLTRMNLGHILFNINDAEIRRELKDRQEAADLLALMNAEINMEFLVEELSGFPLREKERALTEYLLAVDTDIDPGKLTRGLRGKNEEEQVKRLLLRIMSLPEYQLC